jgi:predicted site-specific integrase-resolvase
MKLRLDAKPCYLYIGLHDCVVNLASLLPVQNRHTNKLLRVFIELKVNESQIYVKSNSLRFKIYELIEEHWHKRLNVPSYHHE